MEKYKIKINKLDFFDDLLVINNIFVAPIIKGSVNINIYNQVNEEIYLNNLEENSLVTIYGIQKSKNKILIKKIIVRNNYIFHSDSSEEISDYE